MIKSLKEYLQFLENDELAGAKASALQSKEHHGIHVHVQIHPGYRAHTRRNDLKSHHWDDILSKTVHRLKDEKAGHYLTYSKKHEQGIVSEWKPHKKRLEIITVLPKGRSNARSDTQKHIVEHFEI